MKVIEPDVRIDVHVGAQTPGSECGHLTDECRTPLLHRSLDLAAQRLFGRDALCHTRAAPVGDEVKPEERLVQMDMTLAETRSEQARVAPHDPPGPFSAVGPARRSDRQDAPVLHDNVGEAPVGKAGALEHGTGHAGLLSPSPVSPLRGSKWRLSKRSSAA